MSVLKAYTGAFAGRQNLAILEIDRHLDAISNTIGGIRGIDFVDAPQAQVPTVNAPPAAAIDVIGIDGKFRWLIANPQDVNPQSVAQMRAQIVQGANLAGVTILHQVQSAIDTNFNNSSSLLDYGVTSQLFGQDQRPNETRFFRIRSSFDGVTFNDWQIFSSADTCGPVAVQSGFLRSTSAAPRAVTNNTNDATVDSIDNGDGTDTIRIYGAGGVGSVFNRYDGQGNIISTSAGTIGGAAQSTFYQIVWAADTGFRAFPNATQYTQSIPDKYTLISGSFKTCAAGGGGGVPGGGGPSGGGGGAGGGGGRVPDI